jgi:hypothetical protein
MMMVLMSTKYNKSPKYNNELPLGMTNLKNLNHIVGI